MEIGQQYQVEITAYTHEGFGLGNIDGFVVMVPGTIVGEVCLVAVSKVHATYAVCDLLEVLTPSPNRQTPTCPHYEKCGGCHLQHMTYEETLRLKKEVVCRNLSRLGNVTDLSVVKDTIGMEQPYAYRNNVQYHADGEGALGFYEQGTHQVLPVAGCLLQPESTKALYQGVNAFLKAHQVKNIVHIVIRTSFSSGKHMLIVVTSDGTLQCEKQLISYVREQHPDCVSIFLGAQRQKGTGHKAVGNENRLLYGQEYLTDNIGEFQFRISPLSFFQVNTAQAQVLYEKALSYASLTGEESVLDLYCGAGTISLFLAQQAKEVTGVEVVKAAIEDACKNQQDNRVANARFVVGKAEEYLPKAVARGEKCQVVVVDPPRAGCDKKLLDAIIAGKPERVVYVSCDPATLARDIKRLCEGGYVLKEVQPVDMFPWTKHCECVGILNRKNTVHSMKLNPAPFSMIKSGQKTIELRLFDEKRQQIKSGDKIIFTNTDTGETLTATVVKLHCFNSFEELYQSLPLLQCGYTTEDVDKAQPSDMEQYYSVDEQEKYGVVGIELCRPKQITDECCVSLYREEK